MNWGARIVVSFVVFAMLVFTMVFISMNQEVNLVAEDYYKQEIEYEDQIQRIRNATAMANPPDILLDRSTAELIISFHEENRSLVREGNVHLFRPSDSRLDKRYKLQLNKQGTQKISISGNVKGLWKIRLFWKDQDREYFQEKLLTF